MQAKRSKSNLDDFTTFPYFLYSHCKISILVENDIYNFSSFFIEVCLAPIWKCWPHLQRVFFTVSISDNHRFVCVFFSRSALQPSNFFGLHERPLWRRNWRFFWSHNKKFESIDAEKTDGTSTNPSIIIWSNEKVRNMRENFQISFAPCFSRS